MKPQYNYQLRFIILFFIVLLCFTTLSNILDVRPPERQEMLREIFLEGVSLNRLRALLSPQLLKDAVGIALSNTMLLFVVLWLAGGEYRPIAKANNLFLNCREGLFLLILFGLSLLYSATLTHFKYSGFARSGDGYAYLTQAKIMAQGRLYVDSHPLRQFFHCDYIVNNGKYFACYPLGASLFLLLGELMGVPWLANPVVGSLALVVIYYLIKQFFTPEAARYGVYFILLGNFFVGMNTSYLSHPASLLFVSLFIYFFLTSFEQQKKPARGWVSTSDNSSLHRPLPPSRWKQGLTFLQIRFLYLDKYRSFIAGLALGGAIFTRPLTAAAISFPLLVWGVYKLIKDKKLYKLALMFSLGLLIPLSLLMWVNKVQTGNPFVLGYQLQFKAPSFQEGYNLMQAVGTMLWRLRAIEYMVKFAPLSIFIPIFFVIFAFKGQNRPGAGMSYDETVIANRYPYLFLGLLGMLCLAYLPLSTSVWELRYYYPPVIYLIGLIPWGVYNFSHSSLKRGWRINHQHALSLLLVLILSFKLWGLYQWGLSPSSSLKKLKRPYDTVEQAGIANAIIFIRDIEGELYPQWYTRNSLDYSDDVLYALDLGEENKLLMGYYPKRQYYIYDKGELERIYPAGE